MKHRLFVIALILGAMPLSAHASVDKGFDTSSCKLGDNTVPGSAAVRVVDQHPTSGQFSTIQAAVNAAHEGDEILVHPGIYHENVVVNTNSLRITGSDRNATILDGRVYKEDGVTVDHYLEIGIQDYADHVVMENMTARFYNLHGFRWGDRGHSVHGYWGRYLTAYNNGDYGIFAFDARCGQFDHSYAWGNADSGYYIGNCYPCDAVITNVIAENNALGYSGTNAGGNLTIRDSYWHNNAMGVVPSSLDSEDKPPEFGLVIERNTIVDNNNKTAPGVGIAGTFWGVGIALPGVDGDQVMGNTITDHALAGIVISPLPDANVWLSSGNRVWGNTVTHDATKYPDSYDLGQGVTSGPNNCWYGNTYATSAPPLIDTIWACTDPTIGRTLTPPGGDPRVELGLIEGEAGLNGRVDSPWQTYIEPTLDKPQLPANTPVVPWLPGLGVDE